MRKLKLKEVKSLTAIHTAFKEWVAGFRPALSNSKASKLHPTAPEANSEG